MRLAKPRIAPLADAALTPEQAAALEPFRPGRVLNIFRTLAHAPKALTRFNSWGGYEKQFQVRVRPEKLHDPVHLHGRYFRTTRRKVNSAARRPARKPSS